MLFVEFARHTGGFRIKHLHKWMAYRLIDYALSVWSESERIFYQFCTVAGLVSTLPFAFLPSWWGCFHNRKIATCILCSISIPTYHPHFKHLHVLESRKNVLFPDLISTYPRIDIFHWCDNKSQACWARGSWLSWLVSSTTMTKPTQSSSTWTNNWAQVV